MVQTTRMQAYVMLSCEACMQTASFNMVLYWMCSWRSEKCSPT